MASKSRTDLNRRALAAAVASCFTAIANANPTGPTVTAGTATFNTLGNSLTINNIPGTIIHWQGFSIQANEITRFLQQNSSSAVLNRVTGGNMSQLLGQLLSNGRVFLINPNGIVVGQGAVIDVAAFVASSLNLSDKDFLAGRYRFTGQTGTASVINQGTLTTPAGGFVYLVAPNVENHGVITSPNGQVVLAAGKTVELVAAGSPQLRVEITAPEGEAVNLGDIVSQAGRVGIYGASVRNSGRVSANSAVVGENGKIVFKATKDVTLADGSRVEAKNAAGKGGSVEVLGEHVALTGDASIDVSGKTGGGTVLVGGDFQGKNPDIQNATGTYLGANTSIRADATESGDGGRVIVWSNDATRVHGTISARGAGGGTGGFVETSSHGYLEVTRAPELSSGGTWLLDPYNIEVVAIAPPDSHNDGAPTFTPNGDDSKVEAGMIASQLGSGVNVTLDTGGLGSPGTQAGNIDVNAAITSSGAGSLTLNAANNVDVNAPISLGLGAFTTDAGGAMTVRNLVTSNGMTVKVTGALTIDGGGVTDAQLTSSNGQMITAQSIDVTASNGRRSLIINNGGTSQKITATDGGVNLRALNGAGAAQIVNNAPGAAQTLSMTGLLNVLGGTTGNPQGARNSGVFQQTSGAQSISSTGITLQASPNGINAAAPAGALISAQNGDQSIDAGSGDINLFAAAGVSNNASISASGNQSITARNIHLENGVGGTNSSATILGAHQVITANGDITLTSRASNAGGTGTPGLRIGAGNVATDLQLNARNGGSLIVSGGTADNNGVGIGSTGQAGIFPSANNITINVDRDVILSAGTAPGTGVRIGSSSINGTAGGTISITAGGEIQLNGSSVTTNQTAAIRTLGDVSLSASRVTETGAGALIQAGKLTLKTTGNADLGGPNQVSSLSAPLVPVAPPAPPGAVLPGVGGSLTFNNTGELNIADTVSSGGMMTLTVGGTLNVNGNGAQDAVLQSNGGQDITAQAINLTASNNRRANIENLGVGNQKITATAGGMNLIAQGGSGAAQIINRAPGASQTLSMSGLLNVLGGTTGNPPGGGRNSGVFQTATSGAQSISSTGITLQASPAGTNAAAPSGAQITAQNGDQSIDAGSGDINLVAAAGAGNNASISGLGNQSVIGRNVHLENGVGGTNSSATILAAHQVITANGDITLTSRASNALGTGTPGIRIGGNGGATDLQLNARAGGSLIVSGGTADNNGVGIGSSGQAGTTPQANNITINADRDVILSAGTAPGTGVRIGSSSINGTAGGTISITAGGEIQLNGSSVATNQTAAIRSLGDVSLSASRITETGAGALIQAGKLTLNTSGNADLGGPNQVAILSAPQALVVPLPPAPPIFINRPGVGGSLTFNNTGNLAVTGTSVTSAGAMTLTVAGGLSLTSAEISNLSGDQNITVTGGSGIDVTGGTFGARIFSGGAQTIKTIDSDHIAVNGGNSFASISSNGTQKISLEGASSANALRVGSAGALGSSNVGGANQEITAGKDGQLGSITITAPDGNTTTANIFSAAVPGGSQTITTTGALSVIGGSAINHVTTGGSANTGVFNNSDGLQWIRAGSISLQGGAGGNNTALIASSGGPGGSGPAGNQLIETGSINVRGGSLGGGNVASISGGLNTTQTIHAGAISLLGGSSGTGNNAFIQVAGNATQQAGFQSITASSIDLRNGIGGTNTVAAIIAPNQFITATGDVNLTSQEAISVGGVLVGTRIGGNGGATNLTLNAGNLSVKGGGLDNGAGIGSSGAGTAFANNISITAGSVTLTGGSAANASARIGTAPAQTAAAGNISINATSGDVQLNGDVGAALIRSAGDVSLSGANISETGNAFIQANKLTLKATGNADLGGANSVSILSAGALLPPPPPPPGFPPATFPIVEQGVGGNLTFNNTGNLSVTDVVASGGAMNLSAGGTLTLAASGAQDVFVSANSQTINAKALSVTAQDGRTASLQNGSGNQLVTISGGGASAGIDVATFAGGGTAQIVNNGGGAQTIAVTDADHINVNGAGAGNGAFILSDTQTVSITGSGANAIRLGSTGALGSSYVGGGSSQRIVAGLAGAPGLPPQSGSITVVGPGATDRLAAFVTNQVTGGTQDVSTSGTISITGGNAASQNPFGFASGIFHNGSGQQTVTAQEIVVRGGTGGANNSALLASFGGATGNTVGDQVINVGSGGISVIGGAAGSSNTAQILTRANAKQTISTSGLSVTGGASGAGNSAFVTNTSGIGSGENAGQTINAGSVVLNGGPGAGNNAIISGIGTQRIFASGITLANGAGGINTVAAILSPNQLITATGDIALTAGAAGSNGPLPGVRIGGNGGATNLTLQAANLTIKGGTGASNGAGIGSSGAGTPFANNIFISTLGNVTLNGGSGAEAGARIGYSTLNGPAGGDISINAVGDIVLNGNAAAAAIRSTGNVYLSGNNISENSNGSIVAQNLTLRANGNAELGGPNQVASLSAPSQISIPPAPPVLLPGVGGNLTFNNNGSLNISGDTTAGGAIHVTTNGAAANLNVTNTLSSGGVMTLDIAGDLSVVGATAVAPGGIVIPGPTAAVRGSNQTITARSVSVTSSGAAAEIVNVSGEQKIAVAGGAGVDVTVLPGGFTASIRNSGIGAQKIEAVDSDRIRVSGATGSASIFSSGAQTVSIKGAGANRIQVGAAGNTGGSSITGPTQSITAGVGAEAGAIDITGSNGVNTFVSISTFSNVPGGTQTVATSGTLTVAGGSAPNGTTPIPPSTFPPASNAGVFHNSNGEQKVSAKAIELRGGLGGNGNTAFINSGGGGVLANAGNQVINVGSGGIHLTGGELGSNNRATLISSATQTINTSGDIVVTGGASGGAAGSNNASILANRANSSQAIDAGAIALTAGAGGTDNSASITAPKQAIHTTGDVMLSGSSGTGTFSGTRIGGLGGNVTSATDLTLEVDGSLRMKGGSAPLNGASIGSTGITTPGALAPASKVTITAGGDVVMNSGTGAGARIGTSVLNAPAAGDVSVTAGGSIQMNGSTQPTVIRTTDSVTLKAGTTISQGAMGYIEAGSLTTTSAGDTSLTGPNQVASFSGTSTGGSVTLHNGGPLVVAGINAANAALIKAASVSGSGAISTGTGFTIDVMSASNLNGVISGTGGLNKNGVGELTLGAVNTYAGDTNVNAGVLALGAPDQTTSGNINIAGGATFRGSPGSYTNAGVIAGNGTVDVAATSFTNSGTLRPGGAGAIGTLTVQGNAVINGTLDIEAQGAAAGSYDVLAVTGATTLGGALSVTPINGYAPAGGDTIVPLTFASRSGALNVTPENWAPTYNPANLSLTYSALNRWIAASGNWDQAANWSLGHVPTNFERVLIDVPGSQFVTVSRGAQEADRLTSFENFIISGGSLNLGGPSTFNGSLTLLGGELKGAGNVAVNGAFIWAGGSMSGNGTFLTSAGSVSLLSPLLDDNLSLGKSWTNRGTVQWVGLRSGSITGSGSIQNEGTFNFAGSSAVVENAFRNGGTLNVEANVDLKRSSQNDGAINVGSGAKLKVHGTYTNLGRLAGNGALDLDGGKLVNLGTLAPGANGGNGIGTFTVLGDFQQGATGLLEIDLGGTRLGQYDTLEVNGNATLGGTLFARAANGYVPRRGDDFKVVTYRSRVGTFEFLLPPAGFTFDAEYAKKSATFELE